MKKGFTYLLLGLLLFGCSSDSLLDGKTYLAWVKNPENKLKLKKEVAGINYTVQYKPYDFIILNEEKNYKISTARVEKRKEELEGMTYYNVRISATNSKDILAKGVSNKGVYMQRLNYLSYDFQYDIKLVTTAETINCSLYHFVQGHGVVPYVDMVLGFKIDEQVTDQTLVINDQVFGNGTIKFYVDKENIKNIPHLITI